MLTGYHVPLPLSLLVACSGVAPGPAPHASATTSALTCTTYQVTDLGIPDGAAFSAGTAIDDDGNVAGNLRQRTVTGPSEAFLRTADGRTLELGSNGGDDSTATGVQREIVVGQAMLFNGERHAFLRNRNGLNDLGTLPGVPDGGLFGNDASAARAINESGIVVGYARLENGTPRAVRFANGAIEDLGTLAGSPDSSGSAFGINGDGVIVGSSLTSAGRVHASKWQAGSVIDLGSIGTATSVANAVNSAGDAAGNIAVNFSNRPALFANGTVTQIALLPVFTSGTASGINDAGLVVGTQQKFNNEAPATVHGYIYDGASVFDLNDLVPGAGWQITSAAAINTAGQIVGSGVTTSTRMDADRRTHALILTPDCDNPTGPDLRSLSTTTNGTTIEAPDDLAAGDFLLAALEYDADPVTLTPPPGWTLVIDQLAGAGTDQVFHALVYSHVATASEPTAYTFAAPDDVYIDIQIADYTGVSAVDAVAGSSAFAESIAAPSVTTSQAGEMLVNIFIDFIGGSWTTAPGMNQESSFDANSLQDEVWLTAGPTGTRTASCDLGALAAISLALK
jgi:probable HAF family extracellular repeat protein